MSVSVDIISVQFLKALTRVLSGQKDLSLVRLSKIKYMGKAMKKSLYHRVNYSLRLMLISTKLFFAYPRQSGYRLKSVYYLKISRLQGLLQDLIGLPSGSVQTPASDNL